ncbi:MAG: AI-2E family transporter [Bacilli bacterium]|nr:AI-2E family transporter [Mycoplasmatota bacterium]MDD6264367.1 AI-2E family transporter [bacterium]MDY2697364.1 AI-2E family transporter [Bacilli bacterium]MDD6941652.1 AI-2E family transporter [bacterium]MDY5992589.1 AI-2E family transporter [Bacilli bacterium]
MFRKKDEKVDISSLNEILSFGRKLIKILYIAMMVGVILLGIYLLKESKILVFLKDLLIVISPVFIGLLIAWLCDPIVKFLQSKKIPRFAGCIIVYLFLIGIIFMFLYLFLPTFVRQIGDFAGTIPDILADLKVFGNRFFDTFATDGIDVKAIQTQVYTTIENFALGLTTNLPNTIINITKSIISSSVNFVLGLMIGFYMLFDFDKINSTVLSHMPLKWKDNYAELTTRINTSLRNYVQGVFLVMFLVFITQSIGLTLAGLEAPLLFAVFCAVTDIIPYFGPYIGAIPAVLVGFTISPSVGIFCIISIVIVQLLENNFYQPLIMGHTMQLHPVIIIISLLIFQHFFGIIGMVVATPVVACLKVIFMFIDEKIHFMDLFNKKEVE